MNCPSCNTAQPAQARFCGACGASVATAPRRSSRAGPWLAAAALGSTLALASQFLPRELSPSATLTAPSEIDRPGDFTYASTRKDCSAHALLTDELTGIVAGIDAATRSHQPMSDADEVAIGDEVLPEILQETGGRLVSTGPEVDYLMAIARPLLKEVSRPDLPWRVHIIEDTKMENALALPGGHMLFTRPLLSRWLHNEAQLAAVLGHEIAHIELRHVVALVQWTRRLGLSDDDAISRIALNLVRMPWSSRLEEESDARGAELMHNQGYSVFQAVEIWKARANESGSAKPTSSDLLGVFGRELDALLSSHPDPARRACLLQQQAFDLYARSPRPYGYVGTTNLARRIPMSRRTW